MGSQPLLLDFVQYGAWATNSWLKSLWEKTWAFGIQFIEGKLNLAPPRTGDEWLMPMFLRLDFTDDELRRLNSVRIHQQVLFYSDVMDARGTTLDRRYLSSRLWADTWSTFKFPLQQPPRKDLKLWATALLQLRYVRQGMTLGRYSAAGHKVWEWRYVEDKHRLLHFHDNIMDIYSPSEAPRYASRPNCWSITQAGQPWQLQGKLCTVQPMEPGVWKINSLTPAVQPVPSPTTLNEVFQKWGCMWLWLGGPPVAR